MDDDAEITCESILAEKAVKQRDIRWVYLR